MKTIWPHTHDFLSETFLVVYVTSDDWRAYGESASLSTLPEWKGSGSLILAVVEVVGYGNTLTGRSWAGKMVRMDEVSMTFNRAENYQIMPDRYNGKWG